MRYVVKVASTLDRQAYATVVEALWRHKHLGLLKHVEAIGRVTYLRIPWSYLKPVDQDTIVELLYLEQQRLEREMDEFNNTVKAVIRSMGAQ